MLHIRISSGVLKYFHKTDHFTLYLNGHEKKEITGRIVCDLVVWGEHHSLLALENGTEQFAMLFPVLRIAQPCLPEIDLVYHLQVTCGSTHPNSACGRCQAGQQSSHEFPKILDGLRALFLNVHNLLNDPVDLPSGFRILPSRNPQLALDQGFFGFSGMPSA